jgi:nitrite reductase (NO-forming)
VINATAERDGGGGFFVAAAVAIVVAVTAAAVAFVGLVVAAGSDGTGEAAGNETVAAGSIGSPQNLDVELGDLFVKPKSIEVPAGTELIVNVTNTGAMPHDLKLDGKRGTALLDPGEKARVSLGIIRKGSQAWCTVPGHKAAGMVLEIKVTGEATGGGGTQTAAAGAKIDFDAAPAPEWQPYDPALQPAPGGREHRISLDVTEKVIEVAPGVTQLLWTFGGKVPGPVLRGKVGDIFTVTLTNKGTLGHSIDFHASKVAWNDEMRTIQPNESLVYQFEAKHAGVFMYHCGTAPTLHHIGNGMYGALIVDPPELAPVDHEYMLVQSEFYTGAKGEPGDLAKMQTEAWDAVVFNGYVNQYRHRPIRVEPGERLRVWVLDAGPSENSSFHIVGTIFDTVFKEGDYTLRPDAARGGAQALDLQPAQGGFVEFSFDEPGLYPIVTHKFSNVGRGALGLFQAGEVVSTDAAH